MVGGYMTTANPLLDQALTLARRLSPRDQARLISQLAELLAEQPAASSVTTTEAWAAWATLRSDIAREYPEAQLANRLETDRRQRDAELRGNQDR